MHGNSQGYFKVSKNVVTATLFKGTLFELFKKMFSLWRKDSSQAKEAIKAKQITLSQPQLNTV